MIFSCIIPAYNEGPRITEVLRIVLACPELDEVIVIDDGSTDTTWSMIDIFSDAKLQKIHLSKNGGKSRALLAGVSHARGTHIVMIDADLINLSSEHITALITPVLTRVVDVTLSIRENSLSIYKFLGTDFVSGERVLPKSLFDDREYYTSGPGFGLEVKLNRLIITRGYRVRNIFLAGVITPRKSAKIGWFAGILADARMIGEILSVISPFEIIYQIWYFSRFHSK